MEDRLDVVAVGVEDERCVVLAAVRAWSGRAVVASACGERGSVNASTVRWSNAVKAMCVPTAGASVCSIANGSRSSRPYPSDVSDS
jgi:hypothetical protein